MVRAPEVSVSPAQTSPSARNTLTTAKAPPVEIEIENISTTVAHTICVLLIEACKILKFAVILDKAH